MEHLKRAQKAFEKLVKPSDYHRMARPGRPLEPTKPREPQQFSTKSEDLKKYDYGVSLSDLVILACEKAGLDHERIHPELRNALESTEVRATRDSCDDLVLDVEWNVQVPNPNYAAERAVYLTEMIAYEKACEVFADRVEEWVKERNEQHATIEDLKDRAEYDRLKKKFGG